MTTLKGRKAEIKQGRKDEESEWHWVCKKGKGRQENRSPFCYILDMEPIKDAEFERKLSLWLDAFELRQKFSGSLEYLVACCKEGGTKVDIMFCGLVNVYGMWYRGTISSVQPFRWLSYIHSPMLLDMIQLWQVSNQVCNLVVVAVTSMYPSSITDWTEVC